MNVDKKDKEDASQILKEVREEGMKEWIKKKKDKLQTSNKRK